MIVKIKEALIKEGKDVTQVDDSRKTEPRPDINKYSFIMNIMTILILLITVLLLIYLFFKG